MVEKAVNLIREKPQEAHRQKIIIFVILSLCLFLVLPMVSAIDWDNSKNIKDTFGRAGYKDIEIGNFFGYGKTLWSGTLDSNTEICSINCEATQTIILHEDGVLIDDVIFKTLQEDGSWIEQGIKSYQIYVNGIYYTLGTTLNAGTYEVKLVGEKNPKKTVDWIYKTQGETLDEWAVWTASFNTGLKGVWEFNNNNETLYKIMNLTVQGNQIAFNTWNINGKAGQFNTTNNMNISNSKTDVNWKFGVNTTLSLWFNLTGTNSDILEKGNWWIQHLGGKCQVSGLTALALEFVCDINDTVQIAVRRNDTGVSLFINGSLVDQDDTSFSADTNRDIMLGEGTVRGLADFDGYIDEIYLWNRSLSNTEISDLWNSGTGIFYVSGGASSVNLISPTDNLETLSRTITFSANSTSALLINNMSLWHNETGTFILNQTNITVSPLTNITLFDATLGSGSILWNVQTCYSDDTCAFAGSNRTVNIKNIIFNSQTYEASTAEGASNPFKVDLNYSSSSWNVITGILHYNNTEYAGTKSGTGNNINFTANAPAPSITTQTNVSFYWTIGLTDPTTTYYYNSSVYNQTINIINMSLCGHSFTVPFINFTIYDEQTFSEMNGTIDLTFNYRQQNSTISNSFSYSNTDNNLSRFNFCIDPSDETYAIDSILEYGSTGYAQRYYNFEGITFTNTTTEVGLYLLNSTASTSFLIILQDENYQPIADAEVYMQLYNPATGTWNTVEIATTNDDGETINHIYTEDSIYRFKIYTDGVLLHTTTGSVISCPSTPCTVTITLSTIIAPVLPDFQDLDGLTSSLTYDKPTEVITYTYSDTSGNFTQGRLYVIRSNVGVPNIAYACNSTSAVSTAVLTCDLTTETNGTYIATGYITRTNEKMVERKVFSKTRDIVNGIGLDGVLWSFFLLIGIVMLGVYRPSLGILFGIFGVILLSLLQLMQISITAIVALVGIAVILLIEVRRQ